MNVPPLSYLERYRNEGTRTYSKHSEYSEASPCYQPASEQAGFEVTAYRVPRERVNIYMANPSEELRAMYVDEEFPVFCVHPQVLEDIHDDPYLVELHRTLQNP